MKNLCLRNQQGLCQLTNKPCDGPCGQFGSFNTDLYDDLIGEVPTEIRKTAAKLKPLSTFHMIFMGHKSLAASVTQTVNHETVQGRLTIEKATEKVQVDESTWGF